MSEPKKEREREREREREADGVKKECRNAQRETQRADK